MLGKSFVSKIPIRLQGIILLLMTPFAVYFGFHRPLLQLQRGDEVIRLSIAPVILVLPLLTYGLFYLVMGKKGYDLLYTPSDEMTKLHWILLVAGTVIGGIAHYILIYNEVMKHGYR